MPKTNTSAQPAAAAEKPASNRTQWRQASTVNLTEQGLKNPKKANSAAFERYQVYLGSNFKKRIAPNGAGVPVAELMRAGIRMDDIRHDSNHGFITLTQPFELGAEIPAAADA